MAKTTFSGPVQSLNGFIGAGVGATKDFTSGSITVADYAGRVIRLTDVDGKVTLPTINASADSAVAGPNDVNNPNNLGATFTFFVETSATGIAIKTDGTDKFVGGLTAVNTTDNSVVAFTPGATNDVINLNGDEKGGDANTVIKVTAIDTAKYMVEGLSVANTTDTLATPFADS